MFRVISPFAVMGAVPKVYTVGDLIAEGDPVLKGREHHVEAAQDYVTRRQGVVEQATAAPGERRASVLGSTKKAAAKKAAAPKGGD